MTTRRRNSPQQQYDISGQTHGKAYTQAQHVVVPGRRADGVEQPFPNKPVSHRRPLNPRTQASLELYDFEKITITKQPRGPLSPQEHHSNGIRQTTASCHPRKEPNRLPRGEVQMAKAIYAKELLLQEKLWRVEEKIRQKIQRDSVDAAAGDDQKSKEERHDRGQAERGNAETKTRLSEQQRREPMKGREMMIGERRQEDVKQLRKRQDQRSEDTLRNTHEEEKARGKIREREVAQSPLLQRGECEGAHEIIVHGQEVSGEVNKSRWENVKKHTRRKGVDGTEKARASMGDKGCTREKKYKEKTCTEMYSSDDERDMPQMNQQKTSHRAAAGNHRGTRRKLSGEPLLPPVSSPSPSGRPEQGELTLRDSTDDSLQLLPCRICNRKFASKRLEVHIQICKKVKQSQRQVFNSYLNRTKGSAIEEFWKTHPRTKTPEVLTKKNTRQNHKANTRNRHEGRLPAGSSK